MKIKSHRELRVWQAAMDAGMEIFAQTTGFPAEERYSLVDQVRKSSRSVAANLSEAWRKRRYKAAFLAKMNDAESEATETQTWIEFARRCKYVSDKKADALDQAYESILAQIVRMIDQPDPWIIPTRKS